MNIFIGMEESQVIQRAFEERGHNAWSCDLKPGRLNPSRHILGDVFEALDNLTWEPDIIIMHPVCRCLSVSGQHWTGKPGQRTVEDREQAVADFMRSVEYGSRARIGACIENPIGIMSRRYRKPDQIIQPNWFGDDASKWTCYWLEGKLPPLLIDPALRCPGRQVEWPRGLANWSSAGPTRQTRARTGLVQPKIRRTGGRRGQRHIQGQRG